MTKYLFTYAQRDQLRYKLWRVMAMSKESLRGLIRGASNRERGLVPGTIRSRMRRLRIRLLQVYALRYRKDGFYDQHSVSRLGKPPRSNWLSSGYAHWRDRYSS